MSVTEQSQGENKTVWEQLAEHRETLEMLRDRETALAEEAETLLQELDERGLI